MTFYVEEFFVVPSRKFKLQLKFDINNWYMLTL